MKPTKRPKTPFNLKVFLAKADGGRTSSEYRPNDRIFLQGDPADSVFYVQKGKLKITVLSKQGKEAVVGILNDGDFFGEGCLAGQPLRMVSAVAISECSVMKLTKAVVVDLLHEEPSFSQLFVAHLLSRNIKIEEDLVDAPGPYNGRNAPENPARLVDCSAAGISPLLLQPGCGRPPRAGRAALRFHRA
jgi:CRP-like cAMP-binding protein